MAKEDDYSLKEFIATHTLPHVAKVTQGYCSDSNNDEHDFSTNDVIKVNQKSLKFPAPLWNAVFRPVPPRSTATWFSPADLTH